MISLAMRLSACPSRQSNRTAASEPKVSRSKISVSSSRRALLLSLLPRNHHPFSDNKNGTSNHGNWSNAAREISSAQSRHDDHSSSKRKASQSENNGALSALGLLLLILFLSLFVSFASLYVGHNPLFSPLLKLLVALSNSNNKKLQVRFSDVQGSLREGLLEFTDFQYYKKGKHKSQKVSLKRLVVQTPESPLEVLSKGLDRKLQERFVISNYIAENGTVDIEIHTKSTPRADPKVRFEKMKVSELTVRFFDHTIPAVSGRVQFPANHIRSMEGAQIHTDSTGTLVTDMFLNATVKGELGGNPYDLKPKSWRFEKFPVGFIGDFLQAPLRWFSGASADIQVGIEGEPTIVMNPATGKEERIVPFRTRVAFRDLHPAVPKDLKPEDLPYLPLVAALKNRTKGEYSIEYSTSMRESEMNRTSFQNALVDAMLRDLVNASIEKSKQLVKDMLPAARAAFASFTKSDK